MLKIGLIVGSTRPNRFADVPAEWVADAARARGDIQLDLLDLREANLPMYREPASALHTGGKYEASEAEAWRLNLAQYDGFIATVAEYNHGPTAVLKNALDSAYFEWNRKPIGFVGYGGVGGARAIEQLRGVAIELQMAPIKHEVNIAMEPFMGVLTQGKSLNDYAYLNASRDAMLENLVWWGDALKAAREVELLKAAA